MEDLSTLILCFNLTLVECKFTRNSVFLNCNYCFNLTLVECKLALETQLHKELNVLISP